MCVLIVLDENLTLSTKKAWMLLFGRSRASVGIVLSQQKDAIAESVAGIARVTPTVFLQRGAKSVD